MPPGAAVHTLPAALREVPDGEGSVLFALGAALLPACLDKKQAQCDPADDASCSVSPTGNPCYVDSDCADGRRVGGVCQVPATGSQATACANVKCKSNEFCANGVCLPSTPQCKPPDPSCIYVPHGSFEPPAHQVPWLTPAGPEDTTGGAIPTRPGVPVTFYAVLQNGQTALIGTGATQTSLPPGGSEKAWIGWRRLRASRGR